MNGNTDKPIEYKKDDLLGVSKYIDGLSNFIKNCDTPMTVAIQGDWGSGKTSFMNMIKQEIAGDVKSIWFNTWQFSQFNLEESLTLILMETFVKNLNHGSNTPDNTYDILKTIRKIALNFGNDLAINLIGLDVADNIKKAQDLDNVIEEITQLKQKFQSCVDNSLKISKKDKLVIFIDDLDRLAPQQAIEVLELLKLFLDCDKCVFVLAIDYDVVCSGMNAKYGEGFDVKKGRSFFDKIIQVPFKMPVINYEIEKYIKGMLEKMKLRSDEPEIYVELISTSIGYNPRGMKRILNAFWLLKMIYGDEAIDSPHKQTVMFDVLCLQMASEKVYNYIIRNEDRISIEWLSAIANLPNSDSKLADDFFKELVNIDRENEGEMRIFLPVFCKTLRNKDGVIDVEGRDLLFDIIRMSEATSNSNIGNVQLKYGYVDHDLKTTKKIVATDIKYKICTFGSMFHIGFGLPVTIKIGEKTYSAKTHNISKGRVDGVKKLYEENQISVDDEIEATYVAKDKIIKIEKL